MAVPGFIIIIIIVVIVFGVQILVVGRVTVLGSRRQVFGIIGAARSSGFFVGVLAWLFAARFFARLAAASAPPAAPLGPLAFAKRFFRSFRPGRSELVVALVVGLIEHSV
ncbi:MAG TPA: hypothetical protein VG433_15445, partial [Pirellulales bacterium]|nr:hypothetical protein [Pirellulales bacterium]